MAVKKGIERRISPRAKARVPLKINRDKGIIDGLTKDISTSGVYLTLDRFVPLNTELSVTLLIPHADKGIKADAKKISCHGIVVRNEAGELVGDHKTYGMALCFTELKKGDRMKISNYVKQKLPEGEREKFSKQRGVRTRYNPGKVFSTGISGKGELTVNSANFRVLGKQISLSKNGICCQTNRSIPLFREIAVNLVLPPRPEDEKKGRVEAVQCSAVVISCDKVPRSKKYDMAAYFLGLSKEQKERLENCIKKIF